MKPRPFVWIATLAVMAAAALILVLTWPRLPVLSGAVLRVDARYPGATASEVERLVAVPIEEALASVAGLTRLTGVSVEGRAALRAEIPNVGAVTDVRRRVADALMRVRSALPADAETTLGPAGRAGFRYSLSSSHLDAVALRHLHATVRRQLETLPGAEAVLACGGAFREIEVQLDPRRLAALGLGLDDVTRALRRPGLPGGALRPAGGGALRTRPQAAGPAALGETLVSGRARPPVRLRDLAAVRTTSRPTRCRCLLGGGATAVCGLVLVAPGADAAKLVRALSRRLAAMSARLPAGTKLAMFGRPDDPHRLLRLRVRPRRGTAPEGVAPVLAARLRGLAGVRDLLVEWGWPRYGELDQERRDLDVLLQLGGGALARIRGRVNQALERIPGLSFRYRERGLPVLRVLGPDLDKLVALGRRARKAARGAAGVRAVMLAGAERRGELAVRPDRDKLAALGISPASLQPHLRAALEGVLVARGPLAAGQLPVRVRLGGERGNRRHREALLGHLRIPAPGGRSVPLAQLASLVREGAPAAIRRCGRRRCVSLHFRFAPGRAQAARDAVASRLDTGLRLPPGYTLAWARSR